MALLSPQIPKTVDAFVEEIKDLISGLEYEIEYKVGSQTRLLSDLGVLVNSDYYKYVMDKDTRARYGDTVPGSPDGGLLGKPVKESTTITHTRECTLQSINVTWIQENNIINILSLEVLIKCGSILVKHPKLHIEGHPAPDQSYHCKRCDFQFTPCDEDGCDEIMWDTWYSHDWLSHGQYHYPAWGTIVCKKHFENEMKEYHDAPDFYQPDCPMEDEDCEYCIEWLEKNKLE
ncbi:hypothetical protein DFA_03734 [Cavenderia fasciculata]|uniref:Uncharacterized protein n=1 Tax=Cavenderia fasciculata TaxID=261658 RepID=F4Q096_CACFS|nr:uncharacterized protein DFA_03734 [Cavenderia fasciculata]EGG18247.1 hypothetical protein DFA_03734 [Cavenderia fasciculata]|eukprot:XP_004357070.1 hypothetical protein DFA_03734 [Cavenderia fasciculata]